MHDLLPRRSAGGPAPYTLGTMNFGRRTPEAEARRIVDRALDAGVSHLDTANLYGDGESERIVGRLVAGRRDRFRIATKVGLARSGGRSEGLSREAVLEACEGSLRRLGVDRIDLYYLHAPDPDTPPEATLEAVGELLAAGRIGAWGVSNFAAWQILELVGLAARMGLPPPAAAQQLYNPLVRQLEVEYFAFARRHAVHTTVYNPLAGGLLARATEATEAPAPPAGSRLKKNPMYRRRYWQPGLLAAARELEHVAREEGLTLLELAYAFVRHQTGVDSVLVGPASVAHLEAALAADRPLSDAARRAVDALHVARHGDATYAR